MDALAGNQLHVELVEVTPIRAQHWLDRLHDDQRNWREAKVEQYARDMAAENWHLTGDTVKLTPDEKLLDGQHRLRAVVKAKATVPLLVAYNVDPKVMPVLDTGLARTFADTMTAHGVKSAVGMSALVRRVLQWEGANYTSRGSAYNPTHPEMLARFELSPELFIAALSRGADAQRQGLGFAVTTGAAFFVMRGIDNDAAHEFFDGYISGANLPPDHPVLTLRNRVLRARSEERLKAYEVLALFIRAWNAAREDRTLLRLQVSTSGKLNNQNFPLPK